MPPENVTTESKACRFRFVPIEKSHNGAKLHQRYAQLSKYKWRHSIYPRKAQFKLRANLCKKSKMLTWSISANSSESVLV